MAATGMHKLPWSSGARGCHRTRPQCAPLTTAEVQVEAAELESLTLQKAVDDIEDSRHQTEVLPCPQFSGPRCTVDLVWQAGRMLSL